MSFVVLSNRSSTVIPPAFFTSLCIQNYRSIFTPVCQCFYYRSSFITVCQCFYYSSIFFTVCQYFYFSPGFFISLCTEMQLHFITVCQCFYYSSIFRPVYQCFYYRSILITVCQCFYFSPGFFKSLFTEMQHHFHSMYQCFYYTSTFLLSVSASIDAVIFDPSINYIHILNKRAILLQYNINNFIHLMQ